MWTTIVSQIHVETTLNILWNVRYLALQETAVCSFNLLALITFCAMLYAMTGSTHTNAMLSGTTVIIMLTCKNCLPEPVIGVIAM